MLWKKMLTLFHGMSMVCIWKSKNSILAITDSIAFLEFGLSATSTMRIGEKYLSVFIDPFVHKATSYFSNQFSDLTNHQKKDYTLGKNNRWLYDRKKATKYFWISWIGLKLLKVDIRLKVTTTKKCVYSLARKVEKLYSGFSEYEKKYEFKEYFKLAHSQSNFLEASDLGLHFHECKFEL